MVAFGEVGLAGEVRPVQRGQERLKEAAKLGFTLAIVPKGNAPKRNAGKESVQGIEIVAVDRVDQAIERVR
jgi:DNA repair protein RadA/Sms